MFQVKNAMIESPLLFALDNNTVNPFHYSLPPGLTYGLKNKVIVYPARHGSDAQIYGRRFVFDIPRNGMLAQAFVECSLTCTGDNSAIKDRLGSRVFAEVSMRTTDGHKTIQSLSPLYTHSRIDQLDSNLASHIESAVEPDQDFNNTTVVCFTPCFFWFSERPQNFLNTDALENLHVQCVVNDSKESMGLDADITAASFRLILTYYTMFEPVPIPRAFNVLAYNTFYEEPLALTTGDTSAVINLTCPHTVFNMHLALVDADQNYHRIDNFEIRTDNKMITECNRRTNFSMYAYEQTESLTGSFVYWFSLLKNRTNNSMALVLKNLGATQLKVEFDAVPEGFSLHVFFEYWTLLQVDEGKLLIDQVF